MTDNLTLYDCLQQVSLEKYHGRFSERGVVDVNGLMSLTMQDYPSLGISTMSDRQNLFRLIQSIKTMRPPAQTKTLCTGKIYGRNTPQEDAGFKGKDKKSGAKRPREATENSPVAVKIKTKMDDKIKTETHRRLCLSRSAESIPSTGFYNYGVPTTKPNHSAIKRHQSASALCQSRIQVCVRKRPLTQAEVDSTEEDVVNVTGRNTVELSAPKVAVDLTKYVQKHQFVFDEVFDQSCSNKEVYERTAKPLMDTLFNRGKATCFAYGCTGSGKTFTMLGNQDVQGIYILAAREIFTTLHSGSHGKGLSLWVSFYEIYCGQLFDLLDGRSRLFAREDASHQVCITGLTERHIHNVEELMEVIEYGGGIRSTGATGVNADSSRSHAILQLELKVTNSKEHFGRFSFIDLAGCERAADVTDNDKQTRMEGAEINQSLLALKECIRALDLDSRHTPFRQSKLTQVLKDSFVGNSQTCMIANISPIKSCSENTLNTLRYADRVKELKKDMPSTPGTPSPRPFTVPAPVQDTERLSPVKKSSAMTGKKITCTSIPRLEVQPLKPTETSGHFKNSLKKLKMTDVNGNVRPSTSSTQTLSLPRTKNPTATRTSGVSSSVDVSPSTGRSNVKKRLMAKESQRPKTSPDVLTITSQVESNRTQTRSRNSKRKPVNINTRSISRLTGAVPEEPEIRLPQTGELKVTDDVTEEVLLMNSTTNCSGKFNVGSSQGSSPRRDLIQCESVPALRVDRLGSVHDKGPKETSPLSRNNRYGIGIKTRLAKLFNKGNTEDKGVEPKIENNEEHPPYHTHKQLIHMPTAVSTQEGCHLTLMQEQFVASHHTQLAMVTGLCHEEMVLLKQINNGQKDFKDYVAHLDDILTKKVACIESLREKLPR